MQGALCAIGGTGLWVGSGTDTGEGMGTERAVIWCDVDQPDPLEVPLIWVELHQKQSEGGAKCRDALGSFLPHVII